MAGRRPKPTHLKLLNGNPGKRAINPNEPKPPAELPAPPDYLSEIAKVEWQRIGEVLRARFAQFEVKKAPPFGRFAGD